VGEDVKKWEPLSMYTAGGNGKCCGHCGKQFEVLKKN